MIINKRQILTWVVVVMSIAGIIGVAAPFIGALTPVRNGTVEIDYPILSVGQPVIVDVDGFPLIILKPNSMQLESIRALHSHVADKEYVSFRPDIGAFVYWGISTRRTVCSPLEYKPSQPSQLIEFNKNAIWLGGYWDPICEVSYDFAGRAINSYEHSFNGFFGKYSDLSSPLVVKNAGSKLKVSRYDKSMFLTSNER